ncbi:DUF6124 family protein [Pseudomonas sp. SDT2931_S440]|jgi:hypothetical protein|uniref:DUF6124 family protein n=1 Tax=unclassified Pseudomonas TaxID=196821 RepID=UPI000272BB16|nr:MULTISPECIES: DUF3077 domain-containing protein [unclassified Pseudomonas]EJF73519.1 hypothetical protein A462_02910 [Pseudomonas sp. Ag1]MDF3203163.1 DUF6124 family protein [Pseudomonas sp. 1912-s]MDQ0667146.1 hypothetical protein [Pseudomonas sp. W2I6]NVZ36119.1 DUF3077 domain-containing protein [Pseudomonas sp. A4002]NVZ41919.1 DUF3077 domain-containing protein [Pseudomonas sp. 21615526]
MKKVSPNPPHYLNDQKFHDAAQRAFKHYDLNSEPAASPPSSNKLFSVRAGLSTEVALCNASEILESAAVSAYDCAEHLDGASRKQVLAVVQLVEMAQLLVDEALNRECPVA